MIAIIFAILALIGGYFFLKKFDKIDESLFSASDPGYQSFGMITLLISGFAGALVGGANLLEQMFNWDLASEVLNRISGLLIIGCISFAVYTAIDRMKTNGAAAGKIAFMLVACLISAVVGAIGAIVVIIGVLIVAVLYILGGVLRGASNSGGSKGYIVDQYGNKSEITDVSSGICGEKYYKDEQGNSYTSSGGGDGPVQRM